MGSSTADTAPCAWSSFASTLSFHKSDLFNNSLPRTPSRSSDHKKIARNPRIARSTRHAMSASLPSTTRLQSQVGCRGACADVTGAGTETSRRAIADTR